MVQSLYHPHKLMLYDYIITGGKGMSHDDPNHKGGAACTLPRTVIGFCISAVSPFLTHHEKKAPKVPRFKLLPIRVNTARCVIRALAVVVPV